MADPIDYNALAAQARTATAGTGGGIDYGALAAQARGASAPASSKTDDDIIRGYGYDPAVIAKAHLYRPGDVGKAASGESLETTLSPMDKPGIVSDLMHPIASTGLGIFQLGAHVLNKLGIASDADAQYQDLFTKIMRDRYQQERPSPSTAAQVAGGLLIPVPGGAGETVPSMIGRAALTGGAVAATQPVDVQGPQGSYFGPKVEQTAIGAAAGGATGAVIGAGARALGSRGMMLPEEQAAAVGTSGAKAASKLEDATQTTPFGGAADVAKAASAGDKSAIALQAQMDAAQTPAEIQQASLGLMNWRTRQTATGLYDKVQQIVDKNHSSLSDVPLDQTEQTISDALNQAQKAKDPDTNLINLLKTIQRNIGASPDPAATDELVDNSYQQIRQFRSDLGERIGALRTGAGKQLLGPSSAGTLQAVRDAVDTDLRSFTANGPPDLQKAADAADQYYARYRVPFKASDIAKAGAPDAAGTTTDAEADQIFGKFIQAGRGDKAQRFYDALDPRGRASVRYQIAADAMNQASDPLHGTFDAGKFFNALEKSKEAYGVFFSGAEKAEIDGLKNLAQQAVQGTDAEAARAARLNQVGAGAGAAAVVSGAVGLHPAAAGFGTIAALAGGLRGLMLTDAGRRILADASSLEGPVAAAVNRQAPAAAARAVTEPRTSFRRPLTIGDLKNLAQQ
jgi:hypothetical protein